MRLGRSPESLVADAETVTNTRSSAPVCQPQAQTRLRVGTIDWTAGLDRLELNQSIMARAAAARAILDLCFAGEGHSVHGLGFEQCDHVERQACVARRFDWKHEQTQHSRAKLFGPFYSFEKKKEKDT